MIEGPSLISLFIAVLQMMEQSVILLTREVSASPSDCSTDLLLWIFCCLIMKNAFCVLLSWLFLVPFFSPLVGYLGVSTELIRFGHSLVAVVLQ